MVAQRPCACRRETSSSAFSRADINQKFAYLIPESLETVLTRLRSHGLLAWDAQGSVYRVTPMARNVLSAVNNLGRFFGCGCGCAVFYHACQSFEGFDRGVIAMVTANGDPSPVPETPPLMA